MSSAEQRASRRAWFTDHLANERTHLAYIRTAIALFAFGITLHQFSWFMAGYRNSPHPGMLAAGWRVGLGMVLLGIALALWSAVRFARVTRQIETGTYHPSLLAMWSLSTAIILIGAAGAFWLLWR
jgi:putative membrane protein